MTRRRSGKEAAQTEKQRSRDEAPGRGVRVGVRRRLCLWQRMETTQHGCGMQGAQSVPREVLQAWCFWNGLQPFWLPLSQQNTSLK